MNNTATLFRLTDEQWEIIAPLIPPPPSAATRGRPPIDDRAVLEGIFWKKITGTAWYHLPSIYPSWQTCYRRYSQWRHNGLLNRIIAQLYADLKDRGGLDFEAAVRSRKIHLDYVKNEFRVKYPPDLEGTWQLNTALIFLALWRDETKATLKNRHLY